LTFSYRSFDEIQRGTSITRTRIAEGNISTLTKHKSWRLAQTTHLRESRFANENFTGFSRKLNERKRKTKVLSLTSGNTYSSGSCTSLRLPLWDLKDKRGFVTIIFQGLNAQEKLKPPSTQREKYTIGDERKAAYSESAVQYGLSVLGHYNLLTESIFLAFSKSHTLAGIGAGSPEFSLSGL